MKSLALFGVGISEGRAVWPLEKLEISKEEEEATERGLHRLLSMLRQVVTILLQDKI